jgi:DNA-directed RNA polymerase subunit alpha
MFKTIAEVESENYAKFVIEPLEKGMGHTMGNSLRRVMLAQLEGSAITQVKIEGVSHQFATMNGVVEDVIEIILNLKKIRVKVFSDTPIKLILKSSGKKEVKAKDIEIQGDGEIVNGEAHIASLTTSTAKLNMEMEATKGKGYSGSEDRKVSEIGVMPIDALFTSVINVNYTVEPTRVGRRSNFDKLTLEVTTDGIIAPREALDQSAKILSATFKQIFEPAEVEEIETQGPSAISEEVLKMSVEELDLPVRITNALRAIDINTTEDLINVPKNTLLKAKNLGSKSLSLISERLTERGLTLSEA